MAIAVAPGPQPAGATRRGPGLCVPSVYFLPVSGPTGLGQEATRNMQTGDGWTGGRTREGRAQGRECRGGCKETQRLVNQSGSQFTPTEKPNSPKPRA